MISDHVIFASSHFAIEPGEDKETNPGIYGKTLAAWFAEQLKGRGVPVERIAVEDFGRCIIVKRKPFMLWVACASLDDDTTHWRMFIAVEVNSIIRLFRRVETEPDVQRLRGHYRAILEEVPGISDIEWQQD